MQVTLVHTNDVHGRTTALARIATLLNDIRAESPAGTVVYLDAGDLEDTMNRLSNLTKGVQILQLLNLMDCRAFTVGNAAFIRYGPKILEKQATVTHYPLLLANIVQSDGNPIPGTHPTTMIDINGAKLGVIGMTCALWYEKYYPVRASFDNAEIIRRYAAELREQGAHGVILLSHLGYQMPNEPGYMGDRELAELIQGEVLAIIGGHSHTLLSEGEWVGNVLIAQARHYGEYFGRIDLEFDGKQFKVVKARAIPVSQETPVWQPLLDLEQALLDQTIREMETYTVGELLTPITFAPDRECNAGQLMADALRDRTGVDLAFVCAGTSVVKDLPAGRLSRLALWEACWTPSAMGVVEMTGRQLNELIRRGMSMEAAMDKPMPNRGVPRGLMHLSGGVWQNDQVWIDGKPVGATTSYRIAATDFELEPWPYLAYADPAWGLKPQYDTTTMLREILEDYIGRHSPVQLANGSTQQYNSRQN